MSSTNNSVANPDARAGPLPEMRDSALIVVAKPHDLEAYFVEVEIEDREVTPQERKMDRKLGRLCNAVLPRHWYDSLSEDTRAAVLLSFTDNGVWPDPEKLREVFGEDLMCGYPSEDDCVVATDATQVLQWHLEEQPAPVRRLLEEQFVPQGIAERAGTVFQGEFEYNCTTTARVILNKQIVDMEHALHSYGIKPSYALLKAACRLLTTRIMVGLCVAYQVPVTEAASTAEQFWDDWSYYMASFDSPYYTYRQVYNFLVMQLAKVTRCHIVIEPMGVDDVLRFCKLGRLSAATCEYFEERTFPTEHAAKAYYAPIERCVYEIVYDSIFWFKYILALLFVIACAAISAVALFKLTVTMFTLVRVVISAVRSAVCTLHSGLTFRKSVAVVKQAVDTMDGVASSGAKPLYRMVSMATNSFDSLEMSMTGSEIRTSSVIPGCVHLAVVHDGQVNFAGMAFRYKDYLVTAQHNIFAMTSTPGKYYIIPFKPDGRGESCELDMDSMLELTPEMISRDIVSNVYIGFDATVIPVKAAEWSRMRVKTLDHADAVWNTNVTAYGLEKSGKRKLQRSLGTIIKGENSALTDVFYSASTLKGWSGSPILSGQKKVVALHCGTTGEHNRGLNFAYIRFFIDVHEASLSESEMPEAKAYLKSFRGKNGRLAKRREKFEYDTYDDRPAYSGLHVNQASNGLIWMSQDSESDDNDFKPNFGSHEFDWSDECALEITQQIPQREKPQCPKVMSPRKSELFAFATGSPFVVEKTDLFVSAPFYKGRPEEFSKNVDLEEATALGYDPEAFSMPLAVDRKSAIERSKKSLSLNLQQTVDVRLNYAPPSEETRANAKMILMDWLAPIRYVVDGVGVSVDGIKQQLNSSAVSSSKSPGLPFILEGITTNAQLLSEVSVDELSERIFRSYQEGTWCENSVNFHKIEPTKEEKLLAWMDRTVQNCGTGMQVIMRSFFGPLMDSAIAGCRKSPIMAGWSPLKPGDGEFLWKSLEKKKHKFLEFDGKHFEYVAHTEEAYSDVSDVMVSLAVPGPKVTAEAMDNWRQEAAEVMRVAGSAGYHCADGTVIKKTVALALNSGRFDTYIRNSITGLYWVVIALLDMGASKEEILAFIIKVGGDDTIASVPLDFDHECFINHMRKYGMKIHKVKLSEVSEGFEFFSWHFTKSKTGVVWVPTRFSKHLENFFSTKHEYRAEALVGHMMNWVHSSNHFNFWMKIYLRSREEDASAYPIEKLPMRESLITHLRGYESLLKNSRQIKRFAQVGEAVVADWC